MPSLSKNTGDNESGKFGEDARGQVFVYTNNSVGALLKLAELLIRGTLPEVNYDRIIQTTVSAVSSTLSFSYLGSVQFYLDAVTSNNDYDITIRATSGMTLESGIDVVFTESGNKIIKE